MAVVAGFISFGAFGASRDQQCSWLAGELMGGILVAMRDRSSEMSKDESPAALTRWIWEAVSKKTEKAETTHGGPPVAALLDHDFAHLHDFTNGPANFTRQYHLIRHTYD